MWSDSFFNFLAIDLCIGLQDNVNNKVQINLFSRGVVQACNKTPAKEYTPSITKGFSIGKHVLKLEANNYYCALK